MWKRLIAWCVYYVKLERDEGKHEMEVKEAHEERERVKLEMEKSAKWKLKKHTKKKNQVRGEEKYEIEVKEAHEEKDGSQRST